MRKKAKQEPIEQSLKKAQTKLEETLLEADAAAFEAVKPFKRALPVRALSVFSELGDQPQMLTLSSAVLGAGLLRGDARLARAGGRMIAAHLLATAAKSFIKHRIDRTRPRTANGRDGHKISKGGSRAKEESSFPSGHSAGATAVAQAFAREFPEHRAAALAAAGVIALAQIPRCAHYPTDVGAGIALGAASEALTDLAWRQAARQSDRT